MRGERRSESHEDLGPAVAGLTTNACPDSADEASQAILKFSEDWMHRPRWMTMRALGSTYSSSACRRGSSLPVMPI